MGMLNTVAYYYRRFGVAGVINAVKAKLTGSHVLIAANPREIRFPFFLRARTSDIPTFDQVFVDREYEFLAENSPDVIVDAGANIGLASIFFANRYPGA